jgi:hypothetical protein
MAHILEQFNDDEIEECFDGSSNVDLVRDIAGKCVTENGTIAEMAFGRMFATAIEGYIGVDYDEEPDEWEEAWDNNEDWGISIASNLNALIISNRS